MAKHNEQASQELDTSLGTGMVARGGRIVRFVVASGLSESHPVKRHDENTVLVSSALPTKPTGGKTARTQYDVIRQFIDIERLADGEDPFQTKPTSLTRHEIIENERFRIDFEA